MARRHLDECATKCHRYVVDMPANDRRRFVDLSTKTKDIVDMSTSVRRNRIELSTSALLDSANTSTTRCRSVYGMSSKRRRHAIDMLTKRRRHVVDIRRMFIAMAAQCRRLVCRNASKNNQRTSKFGLWEHPFFGVFSLDFL